MRRRLALQAGAESHARVRPQLPLAQQPRRRFGLIDQLPMLDAHARRDDDSRARRPAILRPAGCRPCVAASRRARSSVGAGEAAIDRVGIERLRLRAEVEEVAGRGLQSRRPAT